MFKLHLAASFLALTNVASGFLKKSHLNQKLKKTIECKRVFFWMEQQLYGNQEQKH